ncbi:MAG: FCD domain-containing protein [Desulfobacteraceae bacterium]|jgi:GntR family transcriptional repressor for pyruvate dehydrogenase complex
MEAANPFRAVADGKQAHEKIVVQIKDAIFNGTFQPGERLPSERELADTFRTSRVTVRSAILTLRNNGIVTVRKGMGGGTFVSKDLDEGEITDLLRDIIKWKNIGIRDVLEVRGILEPQIAYLAAVDPSPRKIRDIWDSIEELEASFASKRTFQSRDENFHKALAAAANNPLLSVFQASLIELLFKFISTIPWTEEEKRNITFHHRKIAEKVEEKEPKKARKAMIEHIQDMRSLLSHYPEGEVWI